MPITATIHPTSIMGPKDSTILSSKLNAAPQQGLLNGTFIKELGLATLVIACECFIEYQAIKFLQNSSVSQHVAKDMIVGTAALIGGTAITFQKAMEKRSPYFKEHKKISLITAGITSSTIVMLVGSSVEAYRGNLSSLSSSEKIQCLTALITALAPVGIAGAWMENVYNKIKQ